VEESNNQNVAGNIWPCVSIGVESANYGTWLSQICSTATWPANGSTAQINMGRFLYKAHGSRFNYLFHDGHVESLSTNATIGIATGSAALSNPLGMWTITPND
jgi:prepilin-type processing-associated H-X9-DG protein